MSGRSLCYGYENETEWLEWDQVSGMEPSEWNNELHWNEIMLTEWNLVNETMSYWNETDWLTLRW